MPRKIQGKYWKYELQYMRDCLTNGNLPLVASALGETIPFEACINTEASKEARQAWMERLRPKLAELMEAFDEAGIDLPYILWEASEGEE